MSLLPASALILDLLLLTQSRPAGEHTPITCILAPNAQYVMQWRLDPDQLCRLNVHRNADVSEFPAPFVAPNRLAVASIDFRGGRGYVLEPSLDSAVDIDLSLLSFPLWELARTVRATRIDGNRTTLQLEGGAVDQTSMNARFEGERIPLFLDRVIYFMIDGEDGVWKEKVYGLRTKSASLDIRTARSGTVCLLTSLNDVIRVKFDAEHGDFKASADTAEYAGRCPGTASQVFCAGDDRLIAVSADRAWLFQRTASGWQDPQVVSMGSVRSLVIDSRTGEKFVVTQSQKVWRIAPSSRPAEEVDSAVARSIRSLLPIASQPAPASRPDGP